MAVQQAELPEITAWREKLEGLYSDIRTWVAEMKPAPSVESRPITINEKRSGEYEVSELVIRRGEGEFRVKPIAKWVVAADGRVDLIGGDGPFTLVWIVESRPLVHGSPEPGTTEAKGVDGWFWADDSPPWRDIPLTGEFFRGLAETCLE